MSRGEPSTVSGREETAAVLAEWVRPHWAHMRRFALRLVGDECADDVLQEALASAWRSRGRFDPAMGQPLSWLLVIVANKARTHHRRRARVPDRLLDDARASVEVDSTSSIDVAKALRKLTHRQQAAVALHYYLGLSIAECGQVLTCSPGTVNSTLSDARRRLRRFLGEDYQ